MRQTREMLRARREALDAWTLAEEAEADPRLYRDPTWWGRLLKQVAELLAVLPLAKEARVKLQEVVLNVTIIAGAVGGLGGYLADAGILALLPPKYASTIGIICGGAGMLAALLRQSPLTPKPEVRDEHTVAMS
jgi:hypothetical protein